MRFLTTVTAVAMATAALLITAPDALVSGVAAVSPKAAVSSSRHPLSVPTTISGQPRPAPHLLLQSERAQQHLREMQASTRHVQPLATSTYTAAALADQIKSLPGLSETISFNQFSGFLPAGGGKMLHYWMVESQHAPATDPLFWWTNGGPGASGLIGFFEMHGPFRVQGDNSTLLMNPYAWNRQANVIYISAPVGVGFSYSTDPSDYTYTNDLMTAQQNFQALQSFFLRFPQYNNNKFYLSGESYGGHYVPQLAGQFIKQGQGSRISGLYIGNPYIDTFSNEIYGFDFTLYGHGVIDPITWKGVEDHCIAPFKANPFVPATGKGFVWYNDTACNAADTIANTIPFEQYYDGTPGLDPYGIDFAICTPEQHKREADWWTNNKARLAALPQAQRDIAAIQTVGGVEGSGAEHYAACRTDFITQYLNRTDVLSAIHVNRSHTAAKDHSWHADSYDIYLVYDQNSQNAAVESDYQFLFDHGINTVIVSGDDDTVCGIAGTQHILSNFKLMGGDRDIQPISQFAPWLNPMQTDQVAGFFQRFVNITLVSVHGAGHEINAFQPEKGYGLFTKFLAGDFDIPAPGAAPTAYQLANPLNTTSPSSTTPSGSGTITQKSAATTTTAVSAAAVAVSAFVAGVAALMM